MSYNQRGQGGRGGGDYRGGGQGGRGTGGYSGGGPGGRGGGGDNNRGGYRGDRGAPSLSFRGGPRGGGGRGGGASGDVLTRVPAQLNLKVTEFEDVAVKENLKQTPKPEQPARRPGYGTIGKPVVLRADFFEIGFCDFDKVFKSYAVKITSEPTSNRLKKLVFERILEHERVRKVFGSSDMAQELVTVGPMESMANMTIYLNGNGPAKEFVASFTENGTYSPAAILKELRSTHQNYPLAHESEITRVLNIALTRCQFNDKGVVTAGRGRQKFFWIDHRKQYADLGVGLEVLRGFYSSVRFGGNRLLLNLNVNHGTFFRQQSLIDLTNAFVSEYGEDRELFHRFIKGLRVEVTNLPKEKDGDGKMNYRQKSIWGVATPRDGKKEKVPPNVARVGSSPANVQFWEEDKAKPGTGKHISVEAYFKKAYNISSLQKKPVVNVGSTDRPIYYPQDVCRILPGQLYRGELCTSQRQAMIKFSCRRPPDNYQSIMNDGLKIMGIADDCVQRSNINIAKEMVTVPARILNPPSLKYGGKVTKPSNGSWNLRDVKFTQSPKQMEWGVAIFVNTQKMRGRQFTEEMMDQVKGVVAQFEKSLRELGFAWIPPRAFRLFEYTSQTYRAQIEKAFVNVPVKFFLVLMPENEEKLFNHLKWLCDVKEGVLTHCCKYDKFMQRDKQYFANNAMKIALKLGGICQSLDLPASSKLLNGKKTMIVGLDVTHPTAMDYVNFPSIAAIVASTNYQVGQWPGEIRMQKERSEVIEDVGHLLEGRLKRWFKENNAYPQNIVIYRDGVSDGQYGIVIGKELKNIKTTCQRLYSKDQPRISFIIVTKRHHVRFYGTSAQNMDKNNNTQPGTVVDRGITRPALWDFYLQAQSAIMGSARPAHYVVMHDEIFTNKATNPDGKPADVLQELTHNLCYMMGRCTRSISYSTPAFLADRFCDRARRYAKAHFNLEWEKKGGPRDPKAKAPIQSDFLLHGRNRESMVYI